MRCLWAIIAAVLPAIAGAGVRSAEPVTWRLDSLAEVGGHRVSVTGTPRIVQTAIGPAVEFNGSTDGLFVEANPLAGLARFTIEVLFEPSAGGPEEQRFLHIEQQPPGSRALIELRMSPGGAWSLDTYLRTGETGLTLLDRRRTHPASLWTAAALTYDGKTMAHHVNGLREMAGEIAFSPLADGRTSIGVRQNLVSWFKGRIHTIRVSPEVVPADRQLRVPAAGRQVIPLWPEGVPGAKPDGGNERLVDGRVYSIQVPADPPTVVEPAVSEPRTDPARDPRRAAVFVVGDSTVKNHGAGEGWGDYLAPFFDGTRAQVVNWAIGGRSTRSFIEEGRWQRVLAQVRAGDVILIQHSWKLEAGSFHTLA